MVASKFVLQVVAAKINWLPFESTNAKGEPTTKFIKLGYNVKLSNGYTVKVTTKKTGTSISIWQMGRPLVGPTGHLIHGQPPVKEQNIFKGTEAQFRKAYGHCSLPACVDKAIVDVEAEAAAKRAA